MYASSWAAVILMLRVCARRYINALIYVGFSESEPQSEYYYYYISGAYELCCFWVRKTCKQIISRLFSASKALICVNVHTQNRVICGWRFDMRILFANTLFICTYFSIGRIRRMAGKVMSWIEICVLIKLVRVKKYIFHGAKLDILYTIYPILQAVPESN